MTQRWPPRREVLGYHIVESTSSIYAFCNDGSIWSKSIDWPTKAWKLLTEEPIPQPKQEITPIPETPHAVPLGSPET
jgi:hypothetical protein